MITSQRNHLINFENPKAFGKENVHHNMEIEWNNSQKALAKTQRLKR